MESFFFGTLRKGWVHQVRYTTRAQARSDLFEYIEVFYNRIRRHARLNNLSPAESSSSVTICSTHRQLNEPDLSVR